MCVWVLTGVNGALLYYNRRMAKQSLYAATPTGLFWMPPQKSLQRI